MKRINLGKTPKVKWNITLKTPIQTKQFFMQPKIEKTVLKQAKKDKNIIYGGQSIRKQIGFLFGRHTEDFDVFSKKPKQAARKTEKQLDKIWGRNHYYVKPALHPGTYKVMSKGLEYWLER